MSAVTLGEPQAGVEITREQAPDKAAQIEAWIDLVASTHNLLPLDGALLSNPGSPDASQGGRPANAPGFRRLGGPIRNPWQARST